MMSVKASVRSGNDALSSMTVDRCSENVARCLERVSRSCAKAARSLEAASFWRVRDAVLRQTVCCSLKRAAVSFENVASLRQTVALTRQPAPSCRLTAPFTRITAPFTRLAAPFTRLTAPFTRLTAPFTRITATLGRAIAASSRTRARQVDGTTPGCTTSAGRRRRCFYPWGPDARDVAIGGVRPRLHRSPTHAGMQVEAVALRGRALAFPVRHRRTSTRRETRDRRIVSPMAEATYGLAPAHASSIGSACGRPASTCGD
jgi:hypothetical protein